MIWTCDVDHRADKKIHFFVPDMCMVWREGWDDLCEANRSSQTARREEEFSSHLKLLMCVTSRTLCLLYSSVPVLLSVARAVIHDMSHLTVHQGYDPL